MAVGAKGPITSARSLVTTPIPDPGLPLLEEAGTVTVLPAPPTTPA
jgi:hypothetical protein